MRTASTTNMPVANSWRLRANLRSRVEEGGRPPKCPKRAGNDPPKRRYYELPNMRLRFATLLALLVLVRPAAAAPSLPVYAGEWRRLSDPVDPPPMQADPVVRDSRRHRLLLLSGSPRAYMTELWSLPIDALAEPRWVREVTASEGPPPLFHWRYSAVYDSLHDRVIVFGGYVHREANEFSNELWALSLADTPPRWGQLAPSGPAPIPRAGAGLR